MRGLHMKKKIKSKDGFLTDREKNCYLWTGMAGTQDFLHIFATHSSSRHEMLKTFLGISPVLEIY